MNNTRTECRQLAREYNIKEMAYRALKTPNGLTSYVKDGALTIWRVSKKITITYKGLKVFQQVGSDIQTAHLRQEWIDELENLASDREIAANFSCK